MSLASELLIRLRPSTPVFRRAALRVVGAAVGLLGLAPASHPLTAQTPVALPYTMTTLAGLSPMSSTAGTQCPNLPAGVVSTDAFGDGCLAVNAIFGSADRGGVQVDAFGNVFVDDDVNSIVHVINQSTGIMTVLAGKGTTCSAKVDAAGDNCLAATQTVVSSQRGMGIDPYGNVLLAGYGDNLVHMVCRAASPICTPAQVGYIELVAGCAASPTSNGSGGVGLDNTPGKSTGVACSTSLGEVDQPRGVTADIYGNVYFADTVTFRNRVVLGPRTSTYFSGNNPLYAALGVYYASVTQGYVYTVTNIGGASSPTAATTVGQSCSVTTNSVTYSGNALDTYGDGCPFAFSSVSTVSSSYTQGVATDAAGNMVFTDPSHGLRVLYVSGAGTAGAKMTAAIQANDGGVAPKTGFVYILAGSGTTAYSSTPTLGVSTNFSSTSDFKVTVSPQGNIFIGDSKYVDFYDMSTGYLRILITGTSNVTSGNYCAGTSGPKSLSKYSDGCPANDAVFTGGNGVGLSVDAQDNLYIQDATNNVVRKVLAQDFASETLNSAQTQNFEIHVVEPGAGSLSTPTATLSATPDMTVGTVTCGTQNADSSFECIVPVTADPLAPGQRSATLNVNLPFTAILSGLATNSSVSLALGSTVAGSALAVDNATSNGTAIGPTTSPAFGGIVPVGAALDGAGDLFTMDTQGGHFLEYVQNTSTATLPGTLPANPSQLAIDQLGDVFAVGSGTPTITELAVTGPPATAGGPLTYTATSLAYAPVSGTASPQGIAVDTANNLFIADKQATTAATSVIRLSPASGQQVTVATGFTNPVSLAVDPSGNVYVADKGASAVLKLTPGLVSGVPGYVQTTVTTPSGIVPAAVATDAAGNLYIEDASSLKVFEVPVSGQTTSVFTGLNTPTGLAVDGDGDVFVADSSRSSIVEVIRNAVAFNFGTGSSGSPTFAATLTDVGNQSITGSNTVTNTTNFSVVGGSSNPCSFNSSVLGAQTTGNACTLSATFVGSGSGNVSDVLSYLPAATTVGNLTLSGTLTGTAVPTTTTISAPTPTSPSYSPSTSTPEVTFTVTVSSASGTPGGTVAVTVDSTTTNPTLSGSGTATVPLYGLTAGTHTISAIYSTSGSYTGSNSGTPVSFTIARDTTTTTWSPGTTTVPYSSPIGTSALNATAAFGGSAVPGTFVYTANGAEVNPASYLPIGSYTLGVTFYPTDSVDYSTSTASGGTFTVTKATTTAAVGATQNLVAADGSGNFTSLQTAINTLSPTTGGSVYIKPGTYNGFVTVVTPFVSLYGLGGNPNNVVVTNEYGAFSPPYVGNQAAGNNGNTGDAASATLLVERGAIAGVNGGGTYTPYNFYAENFTIQNTYNTDTVTTSTNATVSGVCTANQPAQTLAALYNAGTECNSQALAIWITGDQAVLNNVYTTSQQDTIYAGSISASNAYPARQYWFRGKVTGDVDYIFGDAAAVFDHTSIYTTFHGTATGTETIEAQNQADQTSATPSYLSGYIMNSDVFTSQAPGMTSLYFGRPYGHYSTWIMLNSYIDQVAPVGYIEFQGDTNLPTSTYAEYNDHTYTDPATGAADSNGVLYLGSGGNTGSGVTGTREITSTNPGTLEVASNGVQTNYPTLANTTLSQAEAQQYYPLAFLGTTVPSNPYNNGVTNWNPTTAIANGANGFVPAGSSLSIAADSSVTILMRPQVPGLGAVTNGVYTIPTGTYTLTDNFGGKSTTLASGTLDASGSAYYTTSGLASGTHSLTWIYSGDSNFAGSTTASAYTLTVTGTSPTATLSPSISPARYGQTETITATVNANGGATPTGSFTLTIDGATTQSVALVNGVATFNVSGLQAGTHTFTSNSFTTQSLSVTVNQAPLTVTGSCGNRLFDTPNVCTGAQVTGYQYTDTAATVFSGTPATTTTATQVSPAGNYNVTPVTSSLALTTFGSTNYTVTPVSTAFTITGGVPQSIIFAALPAFPHGGTYKLIAQTTSGLPVTYTVTAGSASVSGNTLTVTAAGLVTIKAFTAADPTGDYALATPVSQSFTAP